MVGRHIPARTCVACREVQPKRAMVRIVRTASGSIRVDPTGKAPGRGAYLCQQAGCWAVALRKQALARALKTTISEADQAALRVYQASTAQAEDGVPEAGHVARRTA
jgi:predicted RNA-binding protein YlxR (DUF448 family)